MHNIEQTIEHIGTKIKYYRTLNKISLTKLANAANISKSTLFGLEEGKSNPTISTLINISNTLNINLNELIGTKSDDNNANISLISVPDNDEYRVYKLILMPNEIFEFSKYTHKVSIEVLEGSVKLIDKSISLYCGDSITIGYNKKFKAFSKGSVIILKVYNVNSSYYIKEDFTSKSSSKDLLEQVAKNSYANLINRVIFSKTKPIDNFNLPKYINYVEILKDNNESHYYIFNRYLGLLGNLNSILKQLNNKYDTKYEKFKTFIDLSLSKHNINKEDISLIDVSPAQDCKKIVIDSAKNRFENIVVLDSVEDLANLNVTKNSYYLLVTDLAKYSSNLKYLTIVIRLYRVFENFYILNEKSLNSVELKLYNLFLNNLPKILYFAYNNYIELSISYINKLLLELNRLNLDTTDSKLIDKYRYIAKELEEILELDRYNILIDSIATVESMAKDLNINIILKESLSQVVDESGLYCYIFKS